MQSQPPIEVVAVVMTDPDGRLLTVRKGGTSRFMLPGGKLEPGESARAAAVREVREEVGLALPEEALTDLGDWEGATANEPDRTLLAHVFRASTSYPAARVQTAGEIEELRWLDLREPDPRESAAGGGPTADAADQPDLAPLLTEHVLPLLRERRTSRRPAVAVFCGAREGTDPRYAEVARALGTALAQAGVGLVYGGGNVGLMGAVADAALAAGGEVVGVIPRGLVDREVGHHGVDRLEVVESMHERKQRMADLADAFVALPGGVGTLEELFEAITWRQLGIHAKPVALLDVDGFWEPLRHMLSQMVQAGFVDAPTASALQVLTDPAEVVALVSGGRRG